MNREQRKRSVLRARSVFVSDVHLGHKNCQAAFLLDFLRSVDCERLYLVGDVIDLWALSKALHWPGTHGDVIREVLDKARTGTRVVYVPGNHDSPLREHDGSMFGRVQIRLEAVHETADGRRFRVLHGDRFDDVVRASPLLERIGGWSYGALLGLHRQVCAARRQLGRPYWSLAAFLKHKVGNARRYVDAYERAVAHDTRRLGYDGVVCGHIHVPAIRDFDGFTYCNDGDWVEHCTALVEDPAGRLSLWRWTDAPTLVDGGRTAPAWESALSSPSIAA